MKILHPFGSGKIKSFSPVILLEDPGYVRRRKLKSVAPQQVTVTAECELPE